jgi:hypothetical protein
MWRVIVETALLFGTPFAAYVLFHLLQRRWPFVSELWTGGVLSTLTIVGLAVAIAGFVALAIYFPPHQGTYEPAHIEGGRLKPGRFK